MRLLTIIAFLISCFAAFAHAQNPEHDSFIKYIPDGAYTLLSFKNLEAVRNTTMCRSHPEFFASRYSGSDLPFQDAEMLRSYKFLIYNVRRLEKEMGKAEGADERVISPPGIEETGWIYDIEDLGSLIKTEIGSGSVNDTGDSVQKLPLFSFNPAGRSDRVKLYFCEPEPDILLVSGDIELLKSMVLSGRGLQQSFDYTNEYYSVLNETGEHIDWSVQLLSTMRQSKIEYLERHRADDSKVAHMRESASGSYGMIVRYTIFEDERLTYRTEYVFETEEAAEVFYDRRSQVRSAPIDKQIRTSAGEKIEEPAAAKKLFERTVNASKTTLEGNKVVMKRIIDGDYIAEYVRVHRLHKDYFEAVAKQRQNR